jgi:outer membrane lipoprotein-sorting protein
MQRLLAVTITTIWVLHFAHAADDAAVRLNKVLLGLSSMQADFAQQTTDGKGRTLQSHSLAK